MRKLTQRSEDRPTEGGRRSCRFAAAAPPSGGRARRQALSRRSPRGTRRPRSCAALTRQPRTAHPPTLRSGSGGQWKAAPAASADAVSSSRTPSAWRPSIRPINALGATPRPVAQPVEDGPVLAETAGEGQLPGGRCAPGRPSVRGSSSASCGNQRRKSAAIEATSAGSWKCASRTRPATQRPTAAPERDPPVRRHLHVVDHQARVAQQLAARPRQAHHARRAAP